MAGGAPGSKDWLEACRAACRRIKTFAQPIAWQTKPSRPAAMVAVSGLVDDAGQIIEGLSFRAEYENRKTHNYLSLAIMRHSPALTPGEKAGPRRVLMIEVLPDWKSGHADENGEIKGSHILLGSADRGDYRVRPIRCQLSEDQHLEWFLRLARHGRIAQSPYEFVTMEGPLFSRS